jgi:hypothetical protein
MALAVNQRLSKPFGLARHHHDEGLRSRLSKASDLPQSPIDSELVREEDHRTRRGVAPHSRPDLTRPPRVNPRLSQVGLQAVQSFGVGRHDFHVQLGRAAIAMTRHVAAGEQRWCHVQFGVENSSFLASERPDAPSLARDDKMSQHLPTKVLSTARKHLSKAA